MKASKLSTVIRLLLALFLLVPMAMIPASAASFSEHQIKAAFLYNFPHFIKWPIGKSGKYPHTINYCVLHQGAVERALYSLILADKKDSDARQYTVLSDLSSVSGCHILFISGDNNEPVDEKVKLDSAKNTLIIGDQLDFIDNGGMIGLVRKNEQVEVHINMQLVTAHGFKISSKLLRLAKVF